MDFKNVMAGHSLILHKLNFKQRQIAGVLGISQSRVSIFMRYMDEECATSKDAQYGLIQAFIELRSAIRVSERQVHATLRFKLDQVILDIIEGYCEASLDRNRKSVLVVDSEQVNLPELLGMLDLVVPFIQFTRISGTNKLVPNNILYPIIEITPSSFEIHYNLGEK